LGERNKIKLPFSDLDGVEKYIKANAGTLDTFIQAYNVMTTVLCTEEDFFDLVVAFAQDAKRQNIIYRETMISYSCHEVRNIPLEAVVNGIVAGREYAEKNFGVELQFIAALDRAKEEDWCINYLNELKKCKERAPFVAIGWELGIKGDEKNNYKAQEFKKAFKYAKELGFSTTAHCGEVQGPGSVWEVINNLHVNRIEHGNRSIEDGQLVKYLVATNMFLTLCPTSNLNTSIYPCIQEHPKKKLIDHGVAVSINSDDPGVLYTNLINEYKILAEAFNLSAEEIISLVKNGFKYSFRGEKYLEELKNWVNCWKKESVNTTA
jgi:adenosine deaminase